MNNFEYARASDVADAVRRIAADPAAKFIAGGTNLIDLMKENVARPSRLIDITHLPLDKVEETQRRRLADRRAGAQQRSRLSPADRGALSVARQRDPRRRLAAIAQHGLDRRQSAAADALLLFLRHDHAVQQARAGQRLLGDRAASTAVTRSWARASIASPRIPPTCASRSPRSRRARAGDRQGRRAQHRVCRFPSPAGRHAAASTPICGRTRSSPRSSCRRKGFAANYSYLKIRDRLSYAFALVSVAVGARYRGRHDQGGAPGARRRRAQAVARPRRRSAACAGAPATRENFMRAAETVLRDARGFGHNDFKIELARRGIVRALTQAARGTPQSQADKRIR